MQKNRDKNTTHAHLYPHHKTPVKLAWTLSFPVLISYFSLGIIFGVLFNHLHEPWYFAPLMTLFVYGGAVQFVALSVMAVWGSYWLILFSTIFVAFRNSFYGLSLLDRFQYPKLFKAYMIFALVDANYAVMTHHKPYENKEQDKKFCFCLAVFMQASWVLGTLTGTLFSHHLAKLSGLEFILIAYFAIMIFENYLKQKSFKPIIIGAIAATIALLTVSLKMMLFFAIMICFAAQSLLYLQEKTRDNK